MEPQIENSSWTALGWVRGNLSVLLAFMYIGAWYFLFCIPILILAALVGLTANIITGSTESWLITGFGIISPITIYFLIWQGFCFVGPAYIDIVQSAGIFAPRVHNLTPKSALALVRARRMVVTAQLLGLANLFRWKKKQ